MCSLKFGVRLNREKDGSILSIDKNMSIFFLSPKTIGTLNSAHLATF